MTVSHPAASGNSENEYVIPVILDGENAWEYFHDSGVTFLNVLLSKLEQLRPNIEFITLSDALEEIKEIRELPSIPTGSWIDGTFHIWIGHPEDHAAWEMLSRARTLLESKSRYLQRQGRKNPPNLQKGAWTTSWSPKAPTGVGGMVMTITRRTVPNSTACFATI